MFCKCRFNNKNATPIPKLYVAPIEPDISYKVITYLQTYGEIDSVKMQKHCHFQYAIVQFKSHESVQVVLSQNIWHRIEDWSLRVIADTIRQPRNKEGLSNPLLVAPPQDSVLHMLNALTDDCMQSIFKFFNAKDLSIAAEVCVRFKEAATETFQMNYSHLELTDSELSYGFTSIDQYTMLFRNFGKTMKSLDVKSFSRDDSFLVLVDQYCSSNLQQMKIRNICLRTANMKFYAHLKTLELVECKLPRSFETALELCTELRTLRLEGCSIYGVAHNVIAQHFPKLEEAYFHNCRLYQPAIEEFMTLNPTLLHLSLIGNELTESIVIQSIGTNLHNLQHLEMLEGGFGAAELQKDILHLTNLVQLKVLNLEFCMLDINSVICGLVANDIPIENLQIRNGILCYEAIDNICKLKQIKTLKMIGNQVSLNNDHLIKLAKELPLLSLLVLRSFDNIVIEVDDYNALLDAVENRPDVIKLTIAISGWHGGKVNVPEEILTQHRDILAIDVQFADVILDLLNEFDGLFNGL